MTSHLRLIANRINAQKSTGPRTAAGKRRSAQNALKHGMTGALPAGTINAALEDIMELPLTTADVDPGNRVHQASVRLAVAEARLQYVRDKERQVFAKPEDPDPFKLQWIIDILLGDEPVERPVTLREFNRALTLLKRGSVSNDRARRQRYAHMLRYRAEAESGRATAFREWLDAVSLKESHIPIRSQDK